ncbi:sigma 54-interacting transcriptional regulator [candidate division WOR-3 bacterium]|nr:sigma 54-interacting transcriptional regulator [candidate division WOR-3 bacterium]
MKTGEVIDERYKVLKKLGSGGMGDVYRVNDLNNNATLALKISPDKHIEKEFLTLSRFQHPNIVKVYDFGIYNKKLYFTMEYIPGKNIYELFEHTLLHAPAQYQSLYSIIIQISQALRLIHFHNLIHGDIKPTNILISDVKPLTAKLTDFGLIQHLKRAKAKGTLQYIAPELLTGKSADQRADFFSLGVTLYQILTHKMPFKGNDSISFLRAYRKDRVIQPKMLNPTMSLKLNNLILKLLQSEPEKRIKNIEELQQAIYQISDKTPKISLYTPPFIGRKREISLLKETLEKTVTGKGQVILIQSGDGIGKTRLVQEFKLYAQTKGFEIKETLETFLNLPEHKIIDSLIKESRLFPILIIIEDIRSEQSIKINLIKYLIRVVEHAPVFLIITLSGQKLTDNFKKEFQALKYLNIINLNPLNLRETEALMKSMLLTHDNIESLLKLIYENTGGNPFLIQKFTQCLVEDKCLEKIKEKWLLNERKLKTLRLPKDIKDFIQPSLKNLTKKELFLLKVASILEENFTLPIIQDIIPSASLIFDSFLQKGLITEKVPRQYSFAHKLIPKMLQEQMGPEDKKTLHKKIAELLEKRFNKKLDDVAPALTRHYLEAGNKPKAYEFALRTGNQAKKTHTKETVKCFELALTLADQIKKQDDKPVIYETLGSLYQTLSEYPKAIKNYENALSFTPEHRASPIYKKLGQIYATQRKYKKALGYFNKGLKISKDPKEKSQLLSSIAWIYACLKDFKSALSCSSRAIELAEEHPDDRNLSQIYNTVGAVYYKNGKLNQATKYYTKALQFAEKAHNKGIIESASYNLGLIYWKAGKRNKARNLYEKGLKIVEDKGDAFGIAQYHKTLGILERDNGDYKKALHHHKIALDIFRGIDRKQEIVGSYGDIAITYKKKGELDKVIQSYRSALSILKKIKDKPLIAQIHNNLGDFYQKKGNEKKAMQNFKQALHIKEEIGDLQGTAFASQSIGELLMSTNKPKDALEFLNKGLKIFKDKNMKKELSELYQTFAEAHILLSELDSAEEYCKKGVKLSTKINNQLVLGMLFRTMGIIRSRQRKLDESLSHFSKSTELLKQLGAKYELGKTFLTFGEEIFSIKERIGKKFWQEGLLEDILTKLKEAEEIFKSLNALRELERVKKLNKEIEKYSPLFLHPIPGEDKRLKTLYRMTQIVNSTLDLDELLSRIFDLTIEATGAQRGLILLQEDQKLKVKIARNMDRQSILDMTGFSQTIAEDVANKGELIITPDAKNDPRFKDRKSVAKFKLLSILCIPLRIKEDTIGAIYLDNRKKEGIFTPEDLNFLRSFANQSGVAIENAKLTTQLKQANELLQLENISIKKEVDYLREVVEEKYRFGKLIGKSKPMQRVYTTLKKIVECESPVVIEGETGTGKELVANIIHYNGPRKEKKFVTINSSAISENLIESELFGHKKGAFTGATEDKEGLFEIADTGSIFFDEIAELSPQVQAKLLRVLENGELRRVGSTKSKKVNVRMITATNKDLKKRVEEGKFRKDLYYRLNVMSIKMPPLREKRDDILLLANHFLKEVNKKQGKKIRGFTPRVFYFLQNYGWPGNMRELENVIERAVIIADGEKITERELPLLLTKQSYPTKESPIPHPLKDAEKSCILTALNATSWNKKKAAKILRISRPTLDRKIKKYNLQAV